MVVEYQDGSASIIDKRYDIVLLNYQINESLGRDVPRLLVEKGGGMKFLSLIRKGGTKKADQGARR